MIGPGWRDVGWRDGLDQDGGIDWTRMGGWTGPGWRDGLQAIRDVF